MNWKIQVTLNKKDVAFDTEEGEHHFVTTITAEGRLVVRGELPIDKINNHKNSPCIEHIFNAEIGILQQLSNFNEINNECPKEVIKWKLIIIML